MKITIEGIFYSISKKDYSELKKLEYEITGYNDDSHIPFNDFLRDIENRYKNKGYVLNLYYK